MTIAAPSTETWPALPYDGWRETLDTLHMWIQIVGKTKLALAPFLNEWWGIGFPVTARRLTSGTIPSGRPSSRSTSTSSTTGCSSRRVTARPGRWSCARGRWPTFTAS